MCIFFKTHLELNNSTKFSGYSRWVVFFLSSLTFAMRWCLSKEPQKMPRGQQSTGHGYFSFLWWSCEWILCISVFSTSYIDNWYFVLIYNVFRWDFVLSQLGHHELVLPSIWKQVFVVWCVFVFFFSPKPVLSLIKVHNLGHTSKQHCL